MNKPVDIAKEALPEPVTIGAEAFMSEAYVRAEADKLWPKVWQHACRLEEIPNVGDYITYDILDDTIIVVRCAPDKISAFYNVCAHRGRRLVDGCGHATHFHCRYHAWQYNLKGENIRVLDKEDWCGALKQERLDLAPVRVDSWGGWVWINMDPDCQPLRSYLEPAAGMLDGFEFDKMRYRWRKWFYADCNWKTALEAFMESYHVEGTHPQLVKYFDSYTWSREQGLHGNDGYEEKPDIEPQARESNSSIMLATGRDPRVSTAEMQEEAWRTVDAGTTKTLVDAAARLVDELPEGTPSHKVMEHWLASARRDDAARGVAWPDLDRDYVSKAGLAWHIFPNMAFMHSLTTSLCYRARPHGYDPNKCIFEVYVIERFPEGQEPKTEWVYAPDQDQWPPVLLQDFGNMVEVQKGVRSRGFRGALPNPKQERKVTNLHRNLAKYMGTGAPCPLE